MSNNRKLFCILCIEINSFTLIVDHWIWPFVILQNIENRPNNKFLFHFWRAILIDNYIIFFCWLCSTKIANSIIKQLPITTHYFLQAKNKHSTSLTIFLHKMKRKGSPWKWKTSSCLSMSLTSSFSFPLHKTPNLITLSKLTSSSSFANNLILLFRSV